MIDFPNSPTGTIGLQKSFAIAIRKVFRRRLKEIYQYLESNKTLLSESLMVESRIDRRTSEMFESILEKIKVDLSPVVKAFVGASWWKANGDVAKALGLGKWVPFDRRVLKTVQDNAYSYLYKFVGSKQKTLKDIIYTGITQGDTVHTIASEIKSSFKVTSWKSELIARSETVRVYGNSTRLAIRQGGVTKEYKWLTSRKENVCKVCRPLHGRVFNINNPSAPMPITSTHPQCNCGIVPHVKI